MGTIKKLFIVVALFFGTVSIANAAQWHVKPSGSGTGSGTAGNPWVGFNNIDWGSIQDGDTLTGDGLTFSTTLNVANSNITIESIKFDGAPSHSIQVNGKSNVTLNQLDIKNSGITGVFILNSNNVTVDNCTFTDNNNNDVVRVVENGATPVQNIEIKNSTFTGGTTQDFISLRFNYYGFRGLRINNNSFTGGRNVIRTLLPSPFSVLEESSSYLSDIQITHNTVTEAIHNVVHLAKIRVAGGPVSHISHNTITRIGDTSTVSRDLNVINIFWCENVEIHDNIIKGFRAERPDGAAIMPDWAKNNADDLATNLTRVSTGTKIYNNYIDGNDGNNWKGKTINPPNQLKGISIWKASDTKVYNNVIVNTNFGLVSGGGTQNNKFWNNTVVNGVGLSLNDLPSGAGGTTGVEVINNLFSRNSKAIEKRGFVINPVEKHNLIYKQSGASNITFDTTSIITNTNPFVSRTNYHLNSTSLALNAGIALPEVSEDIEHIARLYGTYDIGAYEYQEGGTEIRADVDQNSVINSTDAMLTLRNSLGLDMSSTNWHTSATTGDVNCDSTFNSTDAMLILRHSLGLSDGAGWCGG